MGAVEILLENGIKVNLKDDYGNTPLHSITLDSYEPEKTSKILNLLLKHGADLNARNEQNKTPLDIITEPSLVKIIKTFQKKPKSKKRSKRS